MPININLESSEDKEKKKKPKLHTGKKGLVLILGTFIVLIFNLILPIELGLLLMSIPIITLSFILKAKDDRFNMGIMLIGLIMLFLFCLCFHLKYYQGMLEGVNIGFNTLEMISFDLSIGLLILFPLIIVLIAFCKIIYTGKEDIYIRDGSTEDSELTRLGKFVSTEQIGVGYFRSIFKSKPAYFKAIYSTVPIGFILNNPYRRMLEYHKIPENERSNINIVKEKGFRYWLFKTLCYIIPMRSKFQFKLYNKLPKENKTLGNVPVFSISPFSEFKSIREKEIKQKFEINEFLTLRLIGDKTEIYVNNECFQQCKFLLINIPEENIQNFDNIDSIDEAAEKTYMIDEVSENLDRSLEHSSSSRFHDKLTPEEEFQGHCSNLQAWYEHDYDTRILHSNLAFPLLKKLTEAGDPLAKKVFKEEIALRLESGYEPVITYLIEEKYLHFLNDDELYSLLNNTLFYSILSKSILQAEILNKPLQQHYTNHNFIFKNFYIHSLSKRIGINPSSLLRIIKDIHSKSIYETHYVSTVEEFNRVKYMKRNNLDKLLIVIIDDAIDDIINNANSRRSMRD